MIHYKVDAVLGSLDVGHVLGAGSSSVGFLTENLLHVRSLPLSPSTSLVVIRHANLCCPIIFPRYPSPISLEAHHSLINPTNFRRAPAAGLIQHINARSCSRKGRKSLAEIPYRLADISQHAEWTRKDFTGRIWNNSQN